MDKIPYATAFLIATVSTSSATEWRVLTGKFLLLINCNVNALNRTYSLIYWLIPWCVWMSPPPPMKISVPNLGVCVCLFVCIC